MFDFLCHAIKTNDLRRVTSHTKTKFEIANSEGTPAKGELVLYLNLALLATRKTQYYKRDTMKKSNVKE